MDIRRNIFLFPVVRLARNLSFSSLSINDMTVALTIENANMNNRPSNLFWVYAGMKIQFMLIPLARVRVITDPR